jgi:hypothetical protein
VVEASYDSQTDLFHTRYIGGVAIRNGLVESIRSDGAARGEDYTPSLVDSPADTNDGEIAP